MRITNGMLSNNMILGLNKNMNKLNTLYDQMNSLKKIQRPSDDPIILGRSLKLRLNVLETEQYKTNVGEARSWMEISEGAMGNANGILNDIRKEAAQAANGTLDYKDRQKITTTMEQLKNQLIQESNANYAGRSVFGGYKTDQKVLFDQEETMDPAVKFQQEFGKKDVQTVSYREKDYYRIRLPYGDINEDAKIEGLPDDVEIKRITSDHIYYDGEFQKKSEVEATIEAELKAGSYQAPTESLYHPPQGKAYFLEDTGELILSQEDYDKMDGAQTTVKIAYEKTNFKAGDPNPDVFFNTLDPKETPPVYVSTKDNQQKDPQKLEYEIGIGTKLDVNVLGSQIFTPDLLRDIDEMIKMTSMFEGVEEEVNGKIITFKDINGDEVKKDLMVRSSKETINLSKLFSKGMGKIDQGLKQLSGQQADLGSRMKRLDLTESRLGDDELTYTDLLSKTEDVELERAFIDFNTQYAVYQSALQVTAKVVQPTLMDFLR